MTTITGRQALLQLLKANGINVLFGNPGTTELPLCDELARDHGEPGSVRYIMSLMEAAVLACADGYVRRLYRLPSEACADFQTAGSSNHRRKLREILLLSICMSAPVSVTRWGCSTMRCVQMFLCL